MSHHWIYINSPGYRRFIDASKRNPWLFAGAAAALFVAADRAAEMASEATNPGFREKGTQGDATAELPVESRPAARATRAHLRAIIEDAKSDRDGARYRDAVMRGRIHGARRGTSALDPRPAYDAEGEEEEEEAEEEEGEKKGTAKARGKRS
jgi:murein DD-endopeptidase MepM/ murein hydrolase activator NlpD